MKLHKFIMILFPAILIGFLSTSIYTWKYSTKETSWNNDQIEQWKKNTFR